jgi:hypothetical protein
LKEVHYRHHPISTFLLLPLADGTAVFENPGERVLLHTEVDTDTYFSRAPTHTHTHIDMLL